jgi:hypothetical protein
VYDVRDAGGNTGSGRVVVTVQNGPASALGAAFSSPAAGAASGGTVSVGLAASGGSPPYTYRLAIDGAQVFSSTTSAASASYAWNTTTAAGGSRTLSLTVTDTAGASARAFTMTVDGTTVWSESSTDSHVTLPWVTTSTPNGARTLLVTVRDAAGATGTAGVAVTVQNP